jgi:NAD(P)-dependent dehydrogenase (short-subunit alcohol dehydrogenase family)
VSRLAGRVAAITGAASGIGRAIASRFACEGACVSILDINGAAAAEAAQELIARGAQAIAVEVDVRSSAEVDAAVAATVERFGSCDIAVANAGISVMNAVVDLSDEDWHTVLDVDLNGTFYLVRAAARQMRAQGRPGVILCTTSAYHAVPGYGQAPYCVAKSGVVRLVECASVELGRDAIRLAAIAPGVIATPLTAAQESVPGLKDFTIGNLTLPRLGTPDDVAALAAFLASDDASYITGHTFYVDGGMVQHGSPDFFGFINQGSTAPITWGSA